MAISSALTCAVHIALAVGLPASSWEAGAQVFSARCRQEADGSPSCSVIPDEISYAQASGTFQDGIEKTGYGRLHLRTVSSEPGLPAFAAGFLEGFLTANRVAQYIDNAFKVAGLHRPPAGVAEFVRTTDAFWGRMVEHADPQDEYWSTVHFIRDQVDGLIAGVNAGLSNSSQRVTRLDMLMLNSLSDMDDIKQAVNASERAVFDAMSVETLLAWTRSRGHCSAVVKLLPDGSELFTGHATWQSYHLMLPIWKRYEFGSRTPISMSSYPGFVSSTDDWYQMGDLVVIETTLPNYNNDLFKLISPDSLPFWVRAMAANQLATSGPEWMEIFKKHNSGTYNCMWMAVDYSKFTPKEPLREGLLTVGEQLPGYFHYEDQTNTLAYGYWPSYNAAVYPETARLIKQEEMQRTKGNKFSYQMVERAQVFRRDQSTIVSDESMQRMLRYNNFQADPIAHGDPCAQPACRSDLVPLPGKRSAFGATDAKYTSSEHVRAGQTVIVMGPTHDDQPVFDWRSVPELAASVPHVGHPQRYDFDWMVVGPDMSALPWRDSEWNIVSGSLVLLTVCAGVGSLAGVMACLHAQAVQQRKQTASLVDSGYKHLQGSPAMSSRSTACPSSPWLATSPVPSASPTTQTAWFSPVRPPVFGLSGSDV